MIHYNRILFAGFTAGAALLCASALADTTNPATPAPTPTNSGKKLECRFEGGGSAKSSGWYEACRAEGEFGQPVRTLNGDEGHLKVRCTDPSDVDDMETIFDGKMDVKYGNGVAFFRAIGDDHGQEAMDDGNDNSCGLPVITVNLRGDDSQTTFDDHESKPAEITFSDDGFSFDLTGRCRIEDEAPPAPPAMN